MPANGQNSRQPQAAQRDYQELVRKVAERVLQMWRAELRRNRERAGRR